MGVPSTFSVGAVQPKFLGPLALREEVKTVKDTLNPTAYQPTD